MSTPRRPTVLVVDDNPTDGKLARILLSLGGCEVRLVGSAEEALGVLAKAPPDLLLVDIDLPGMSGLELARRLRAAAPPRALPIVVMSSTAGSAAGALARSAGCDAFLAKPLDPDALQATLARLMPREKDHPATG